MLRCFLYTSVAAVAAIRYAPKPSHENDSGIVEKACEKDGVALVQMNNVPQGQGQQQITCVICAETKSESKFLGRRITPFNCQCGVHQTTCAACVANNHEHREEHIRQLHATGQIGHANVDPQCVGCRAGAAAFYPQLIQYCRLIRQQEIYDQQILQLQHQLHQQLQQPQPYNNPQYVQQLQHSLMQAQAQYAIFQAQINQARQQYERAVEQARQQQWQQTMQQHPARPAGFPVPQYPQYPPAGFPQPQYQGQPPPQQFN